MNAGRKSLRDQGDLENGSFRFQKAVPGIKKTPQWSAARRAGPRHGPAVPSRWRDRLCRKAGQWARRSAPANFGAPLPSFGIAKGSNDNLRRQPAGMRRAAPRGWARRPNANAAFWRNEPEVLGAAVWRNEPKVFGGRTAFWQNEPKISNSFNGRWPARRNNRRHRDASAVGNGPARLNNARRNHDGEIEERHSDRSPSVDETYGGTPLARDDSSSSSKNS